MILSAFKTRPLLVSLAVATLVLAAIIALEIGLGTTQRAAPAPAAGKRAASAEVKLLPPLAAIAPEQAYPETAARPLLTPTRRPAPEATVVVKSSFVPGQFVLQGVIVAGATRIALLREKSNGRIHRMESGREVNGVKVIDIQPGVVTMGQGGEQETLSMQVQRPAPAPAAAAAMPAHPGPFAAPPTSGPQPPPPVAAPPQPGPQGAPIPRPPFDPAAPAGPPVNPAGSPFGNPLARDTPAGPMTPEELLARRRAGRVQPTQ